VDRFAKGDEVELRESATATRGTVVWVSEDGSAVRIKWTTRFGDDGRTTTHEPRELRKVR
jgi:hypothetical protein